MPKSILDIGAAIAQLQIEVAAKNLVGKDQPNYHQEELINHSSFTSDGALQPKLEKRLSNAPKEYLIDDDHLSIAFKGAEANEYMLIFKNKVNGQIKAIATSAQLELDNNTIVLLGDKNQVLQVVDKSVENIDRTRLKDATIDHLINSDPEPTTEVDLNGSILNLDIQKVLHGQSQLINMAGNSRIDGIIQPGVYNGKSLKQGMTISVKVDNNENKTYTYGGIAQSVSLASSPIFGAKSSNERFTIPQGAQVPQLTIGGHQFEYSPQINANNPNQFNSLDSLRVAIERKGFLANIYGNRLYISSKTPNKALEFGGNMAQLLGLSNIADAAGDVERFSTLAQLESLLKEAKGIGPERVDANGKIIQTGNFLQFGAQDASSNLTIDTNEDDTWFETKEIYIKRNAADLQKLEIYSPHHGMQAGDWVEISDANINPLYLVGGGGGAGQQFINAGANINGQKFRIITTSQNSFTVSFAVNNAELAEANNFIAGGGVGERVSILNPDPTAGPTKFRKIAGEQLNPVVIEPTTINRGGGDDEALLAFPGAHGLVVGDRVEIKGMQALNINGGLHILPDGVYTVTAINVGGGGNNNITIAVPNMTAAPGAPGALILARTVTITKVANVNINVAEEIGGTNEFRIFEKGASSKYARGDKVKFTGLNAAAVLTNDKEYEILGTGKSAEGEYFIVRKEGALAGGNNFFTYAGGSLGDFRINHLSGLKASMGLNRSESLIGPSYDPYGESAPNMSRVGAEDLHSDKLKNVLKDKIIHQGFSLHDNRGVPHKMMLKVIPVSENKIAVEIAIEKNENGSYSSADVKDNSDGVIARGFLEFDTDGKIITSNTSGNLLSEIQLSWLDSSGDIGRHNNFKLKLDDFKFFGTGNMGSAANRIVAEANGRPSDIIRGSQDVTISEDGTIKLKYFGSGGLEAEPYKIPLAKVQNFQKLGRNGRFFTDNNQSGKFEFKFADQIGGKIQSKTITGSNVGEPAQLIQSIKNYNLYRIAIEIIRSQQDQSEKEIMNMLKG